MQRPYPLPSDPNEQSVEKFLRNGITTPYSLKETKFLPYSEIRIAIIKELYKKESYLIYAYNKLLELQKLLISIIILFTFFSSIDLLQKYFIL